MSPGSHSEQSPSKRREELGGRAIPFCDPSTTQL